MDLISERIRQLQYFLLALIPAFSVLPRFYIGLYMGLFISASLYQTIEGYYKKRFVTPMRFVGVGLLLVHLLYTVVCFGVGELSYQWQSGLLIYFVAAAFIPLQLDVFLDEKWRALFTRLCLLGATFVGSFAVTQYLGLLPVTNSDSIYSYHQGAAFFRSTALFPNSTTLGLYLLFILPVVLVDFFKRPKLEFYPCVVLVLTFLGLASSFGRMSFLLSVCLFALLVVISFRKRLSFKLIGLILFPGFAFVIGFLSQSGDNEMMARFQRSLEWNGASLQRVQEASFGFDLAKENFLGYGSSQIAKKAEEHIEKRVEAGEVWESREWHGIHLYFLNVTLFWGVVAALILGLFMVWPLILLGLGMPREVWIFSAGFLLCLVIYSLTDSFIYTEVAVLSIVVLYFISSIDEMPITMSLSQMAIFPIAILLFFSLPTLRRALIDSVDMSRVYIDNPGSETKEVTISQAQIKIPPGRYWVWNTRESNLSFAIGEESFDFDVSREKGNGKSSFLIPLEDKGPYQKLEYAYSSELNEITMGVTEGLYPLKNTIYSLPNWFGVRSPEFLEVPEKAYKKAFTNVKGKVRVGLAQKKIWRKVSSSQLLENCWEPIWYYLTSDPNFSICRFNVGRSAYGASAIKGQLKFMNSLWLYLVEGKPIYE